MYVSSSFYEGNNPQQGILGYVWNNMKENTNIGGGQSNTTNTSNAYQSSSSSSFKSSQSSMGNMGNAGSYGGQQKKGRKTG